MRTIELRVAAIVLALVVQVPAAASMLTVTAFDNGWWRSGDVSNAVDFPGIDSNTFTGDCCQANHFRNFFVFDLAGLGGEVVAATLRLGRLTFGGIAADETYVLRGYEGSIADLTTTSGTPGVYDALGAGPLYATVMLSAAADEGRVLDIELDEAALLGINAALGDEIAFGGDLVSTFGEGNTVEDYIRFDGGAASGTFELVLSFAVPEPQTPGLAVAGLLLVLSGLRRRGRRAPVRPPHA